MKFFGKYSLRRLYLLLSVTVLIVISIPLVNASASSIPNMIQLEWGGNVESNSKAAVDFSNIDEGLVKVKYNGSTSKRIKVQITKSGGVTYTYNLNSNGYYETLPLTAGNGTYEFKVFENVSGTKYAQVFSESQSVNLRNSFLPFLYSNQYVNYSASKNVAALGVELTAGLATDLEKLHVIYGYVVSNYTYDFDLAAKAPSTYLPVIDNVMKAKKGICFDYSALMGGLLRTQNIPCKLVVGYQGSLYHAWIDVYLADIGWVEKAIYFDGSKWSMMDPTYAAGSSSHFSSETYSKKYAY